MVLLVALAATGAACGGGPSGPDGAPILGPCDGTPNYVSQVTLNRWRRFPLRLHVMEATFPEANRERALARIRAGLALWAEATGGRIGTLVETSRPEDADLVVLVEDLQGFAAARTTHEGGRPFLSGGRIVFDRQVVIEGAAFENPALLAALAAHEMGHLLGIIGHPFAPEDALMHSPFGSLTPTPADVNTLNRAYCR